MTTTRTTTSLNENSENAISWINRGLEFLWLLTLIAVPLAFVDREALLSESELAYVDVPKTVLLRALVGLMAVLWLIEWALRSRAETGYSNGILRQPLRPESWLRNLTGWLRRDPTRWVTLAVLLYLASTLLSTALSESFSVSMWGLVPGQDTYPAYTITCYVVLFGVIATHLKSEAQVMRLLWAIAIMGVLVGGYSWAQFYGYDVFSLLEIPGGKLLGSTMGNSILAGALLLMSIPVSLAAATLALRVPVRSKGFWGKLGLWTLLLTLQMTALIFASARGPWGGTVVGLVVLLALVASSVGWRSFATMGLVFLLGCTLTVALMLKPPPIPTGEPVKIEDYEYPAPVEAASPILSASQQITSIGQEVAALGQGADEGGLSGSIESVQGAGGGGISGPIESVREADGGSISGPIESVREAGGGGLSGRIGIWEASGRLIVKRPWFDFDSGSLRLLRPLIGYGPDTFKYTYLLERAPKGPNRALVSERFAHNLLIHQGVELGLLGMLTTLGLFAAPFLVGGYQLIRRGNGHSTFQNLVLCGLLGAFAGRFAEQMVGVAAVSGLTVFWVLLALFAALPAAARELQPSTGPTSSLPQRQRPRRFNSTTRTRISGVKSALPLVVAGCLIAGIGALTWVKSINYLEAGFKAQDGLNRIREANFQAALVSLEQAIHLAPDVSVYHTLRAAVYSGYLLQDDGPREPECVRSVNTTAYEVCLAQMNYLNHREAAQKRPLDWHRHLNLAEATLTLALMEGDADMASEAIRLYRKVAQLDPHALWHWKWVAAAQIKLGRIQAALTSLEKSMSSFNGGPRSANSRLLQGVAYSELGEHAPALTLFDEAIRLDPKFTDAYINRGESYNALGQYQRAIQDLDEAINLNPEMALAYNNRGNSYGNLDQLERAIEDYDEALRLDRQFALAYSNRALAYTYLGRDEKARADVLQAIEFGFDPVQLLARMEEIRITR